MDPLHTINNFRSSHTSPSDLSSLCLADTSLQIAVHTLRLLKTLCFNAIQEDQ
jgi:hypothetical protein